LLTKPIFCKVLPMDTVVFVARLSPRERSQREKRGGELFMKLRGFVLFLVLGCEVREFCAYHFFK
jgi:hypothetical protein